MCVLRYEQKGGTRLIKVKTCTKEPPRPSRERAVVHLQASRLPPARRWGGGGLRGRDAGAWPWAGESAGARSALLARESRSHDRLRIGVSLY